MPLGDTLIFNACRRGSRNVFGGKILRLRSLQTVWETWIWNFFLHISSDATVWVWLAGTIFASLCPPGLLQFLKVLFKIISPSTCAPRSQVSQSPHLVSSLPVSGRSLRCVNLHWSSPAPGVLSPGWRSDCGGSPDCDGPWCFWRCRGSWSVCSCSCLVRTWRWCRGLWFCWR